MPLRVTGVMDEHNIPEATIIYQLCPLGFSGNYQTLETRILENADHGEVAITIRAIAYPRL